MKVKLTWKQSILAEKETTEVEAEDTVAAIMDLLKKFEQAGKPPVYIKAEAI